VSAARQHPYARPPDLDLDAMELAIGHVTNRRIPEQIVRARVTDDLRQPFRWIVRVDDGPAPCFAGEPLQHVRASKRSVPERPRIEDVNRHVPAIGRLQDILQPILVRTADWPHERSLAHEEHGLATFAKSAEMGNERVERRERDAPANFPHVADRELTFLERAPHRVQLAAASLELTHPPEKIIL